MPDTVPKSPSKGALAAQVEMVFRHRHGTLIPIVADIRGQRIEVTEATAFQLLEGSLFATLLQRFPETAQAVNATPLQHEVVAVAFNHQKPAEPAQRKQRGQYPATPEQDAEYSFQYGILIDRSQTSLP